MGRSIRAKVREERKKRSRLYQLEAIKAIREAVVKEYNLEGDDLKAFNDLLDEENEKNYFALEGQIMVDHPNAPKAAAVYRDRCLPYLKK